MDEDFISRNDNVGAFTDKRIGGKCSSRHSIGFG